MIREKKGLVVGVLRLALSLSVASSSATPAVSWAAVSAPTAQVRTGAPGGLGAVGASLAPTGPLSQGIPLSAGLSTTPSLPSISPSPRLSQDFSPMGPASAASPIRSADTAARPSAAIPAAQVAPARVAPVASAASGRAQEARTSPSVVATPDVAPSAPVSAAASGSEAPAGDSRLSRAAQRPASTLIALGTLSASQQPSLVWDNARRAAPLPAAADIQGRSGAPGGPFRSADSQDRNAPGAAGSRTVPAAPAVRLAPAPAASAAPVGTARPAAAVSERASEPVLVPKQDWARRLRDSLGYASILASSVRWRLSRHLVWQWETYKESFRKAGPEHAVKARTGFFAEHLVMGSVGRMGPFGLREAENGIVVEDSWYLFNKYFPADQAATASFAGFIARAQRYNPNRRVTQFRKMLFAGIEKAAALPVSDLPAFFDKLASPEESAKLGGYQHTDQARDLAVFSRLVDETILEVGAGLPAGQRIVGVVLMGSFANGAAGPTSDLDAQAIAENGSPAHIKRFFERLEQRWHEAGMDHHELGSFQYALPLSKGLVGKLHREHYLVFSPYPEVRQLMQRSEAEDALQRPSRLRTLSGRLFNVAYVGVVCAILGVYELYQLIASAGASKRSSP